MSAREPSRECPACGAVGKARARYCGACGRALSGGAARVAAAKAEVRRAMLAVGILYLGVLALLVLFAELPFETESAPALVAREAVFCAGLAVLGGLAAASLGRGAARESLAGRAAPAHVGLGAGLGVAVIAVNVAWTTGLAALVPGADASVRFAFPDAPALLLLSAAVLPALFEEWLTRGILWAALRRLADVRATIFLSAALFAMLHGLGDARLLELPGRFLAGLALGWLRARTGSLWPGIAGHFTNNAIACFLV